MSLENKNGLIAENKSPRTRNYALDLLRILSMWMIVCLHLLNRGGVLAIASEKNHYVLTFLLYCCIIAVNLYVLISSYFLVTQKFRPSKLLRLYLEVVFWCLIGYLFGILFGNAEFAFSTLVFEVLCPFSSTQYWFLSAYVILYLVSPILNVAIRNLTKRQHLAVCIGLLLFFSVWVDLHPITNYFNFNNGYSPVWFVILYFIGSYLRLHADPKKWKRPLLWAFLSVLAIFTLKVLLPEAQSTISFLVYWRRAFDNYNSIFVTLESIFLFVAFLKCNDKIKGIFLKRLIAIVSPLTLGVYLIHEHPNFRDFFWHTLIKSQDFPGDSIWLIPLSLATITAVFLSCLALSGVRSLLFSLFEKRSFWKKFLEKLDALVLGTLDKLAGRLEKNL